MVYARTLLNRGRLESRLARPGAAMKYFEASLALTRELKGPHDTLAGEALFEQALALNLLEDLPAAERAARQAVEIYSTEPKLNPDRVFAAAALAEILREQHRFAESSAMFHEVLQANRRIYGENHRSIASALDSLARIAQAQHRLAEAENLARQAVECASKVAGTDYFMLAYYRTSLGSIQNERGEWTEAEAQWRAALALFEKSSPADNPHRAAAEYHLGVVLLAKHRPKDAEAYFRAAMGRAQRSGESEWRVARAASGLGEALYAQGRVREAESYLVNSYRTVSSSPSADARTQEVVRNRIARFYTERGEIDKLPALSASVDL